MAGDLAMFLPQVSFCLCNKYQKQSVYMDKRLLCQLMFEGSSLWLGRPITTGHLVGEMRGWHLTEADI